MKHSKSLLPSIVEVNKRPGLVCEEEFYYRGLHGLMFYSRGPLVTAAARLIVVEQ